MAEIYRDKTTTALQFGVSGATVTQVEFYRNDTLVDDSQTSSPALVPYTITKDDGPFTVKWYYTVASNPYERTEQHEVITPLFTEAELEAWDSDFEALTSAQIVSLESKVRAIVETYTNNHFGYRTDSVEARGNGTYELLLPDRLLSLTSVDGFEHPQLSFSINNDGYLLSSKPSTAAVVNSGVPIGDYRYYRWQGNRIYTIYGDFGYYSVPEEVKHAALLIAEAFGCKESLWRERFIKSVRAADWRFDFSEETFRSTGSLTADQLLDPFVRYGLVAV